MNDSGETWYVKLANGDVHPVTIDQLDWAFEHGHVDADTLVLCEEAENWTRLGEIAGLDDEPAAAAPAPAPAPPVASYAPRQVASYTPQRMAYAPTPTPATAAATYTPAPRAVVRAPYQPPAANSLRPVSMDLDDFDLNSVPFKSRSRKGWLVAVLAVALMSGGVGVAAKRLHLDQTAAAPQSVAATAPPPAETHIPYQTPAPVVAAAAAPAGDSPLNPRFTEAQKDKLLKADKQRDEKPKAHASGGGGHSSTKYKSMGFTTGGNKYDPMNSSL